MTDKEFAECLQCLRQGCSDGEPGGGMAGVRDAIERLSQWQAEELAERLDGHHKRLGDLERYAFEHPAKVRSLLSDEESIKCLDARVGQLEKMLPQDRKQKLFGVYEPDWHTELKARVQAIAQAVTCERQRADDVQDWKGRVEPRLDALEDPWGSFKRTLIRKTLVWLEERLT